MTYHLNDEEKAIVYGKTGEVVRPSCYTDLRMYHSYLVGRGHTKFANSVLRDVFNGEKTISKMIANSQKRFKEEAEDK